jgi:hypothetical protein
MEKTIHITLPADEAGMVGRECPECKRYFKVKSGTGLPTTECICPYCGKQAAHNQFVTEAQIEYAKSVAVKEAIGPSLRKLENTLKGLERSTRGGFIQFKVKTTGFNFPLKHYQEKELETHVVCDNCGLEFAIYGVFANCPDCGNLNVFKKFSKSIEVARKRLKLIDSLEAHEKELKEAILEDAISGGVSAFDALGKALRAKYPEKLPQKPKNLFQNIFVLSKSVSKTTGKSIEELIGKEDFAFEIKMFQVRHIYEHNMGVVDDDFIRHVPDMEHLIGRKYALERKEIEKFLDKIEKLGNDLMVLLK